jgi:hypothetical protein
MCISFTVAKTTTIGNRVAAGVANCADTAGCGMEMRFYYLPGLRGAVGEIWGSGVIAVGEAVEERILWYHQEEHVHPWRDSVKEKPLCTLPSC